jgi:hypothetical protein
MSPAAITQTTEPDEREDQQLVLLCTRLSRLHFYTGVGAIPEEEMNGLTDHYVELAREIMSIRPTSERGVRAKGAVALQVMSAFMHAHVTYFDIEFGSEALRDTVRFLRGPVMP